MKNIIILFGIILTILLLPHISLAASWYVDNAVIGSNNGTSWADAWQSFANINWSLVQPGDIIYISGGTVNKTYNETLNIGTLGNSGNRITITVNRNAVGHNGQVIIDCQSTRLNGVIMRDYVTLDGVDSSYGIKVQNCIGSHVRKYSTGNATGYTIRYIEITGRTVGSSEGCIHLGAAQSRGHLVEYNYIHDVNGTAGIHGITLINNTGDDGQPYTTNEIGNNTINNTSEDGIEVRSAAYVHNNIVRHATIFAAHIDGIVAQGNNVWIVNNNVGEFGQNIYINTFNGTAGIGIKVFGNLIYQTPSSLYWGAGHGIVLSPQSVTSCGSINGVEVYNNTIVEMDNYGLTIQSNANCSLLNATIKNNLFINSSNKEIAWRNSPGLIVAGMVIDFNFYHGGSEDFLWNGGNNSYLNFSTWKTGEGFDNNSAVVANPYFSDEANHNYRLTNNSAELMDKGVVYNNRIIDIASTLVPQGLAYDIGAYEYVQAAPLPDTTPPSAPSGLMVE